ncbi:MAG: ribose-phosphate pyrophosphokinase [Anaerolineae bacterium]|jgi:ribose-phosphate pyrophosphokinase|uniref:ribose-phosphate diphosphokinase n=1 Tax=Candidatus Amarolinea dominans TaxID=3140696 RepID=UPI001D9A0FFF|nr:ribose-phosphate pyrophosphokinase [Anaerolineae bacterium]MBK7199376.1 ribose-phosphate pyrophosphokinase [Anaerolineae bacterium]
MAGLSMYGKMAVFSGSASPPLANAICRFLRLKEAPDFRLGQAEITKFANGNTFCKLDESVRGKDVFLIQSTSAPTNDNVMELLIFLDTLRRDSAGRITAVLPFYGYGRTDKKDQPRVPITARLVADLITVAGADRFVTVDLHAGQIQGFFTIPTDELTALYPLVDHFARLQIPNLVVVSPDVGGVRRARNFAERLSQKLCFAATGSVTTSDPEIQDRFAVPLAVIEKRRSLDGKQTEMFELIGDVDHKNVIVVDDEIDTAGTLCKAGAFLPNRGAIEVYACATHAVLSDAAAVNLRDSVFKQVVVADTVAIPSEKSEIIGCKLVVVSVAEMLADVILRTHNGESVGALFDKWDALDHNLPDSGIA